MPESAAFFIASETNLMTTLITDRSTLKANTDADFERIAERRGAPLVMAHMLDGPVDRSEARRYFDSHRRDWKEVSISVGTSFRGAALTWGFKSQETPEINAGSHAANSGFVHIFDRLAIALADSNHEKLNGMH